MWKNSVFQREVGRHKIQQNFSLTPILALTSDQDTSEVSRRQEYGHIFHQTHEVGHLWSGGGTCGEWRWGGRDGGGIANRQWHYRVIWLVEGVVIGIVIANGFMVRLAGPPWNCWLLGS